MAMITYTSDVQYNRKTSQDRCVRWWLAEYSVTQKVAAGGAASGIECVHPCGDRRVPRAS
jgi:hypothetical protein